jgi:hypothetical protein
MCKKDCKCEKPKYDPTLDEVRFKQRLQDGGYVYEHPLMTYRERVNDSVASKLPYGSLVIPVKYTSMVLSSFPELKNYREDTSHMPKQDVIVMPNETVVPPGKAKEVVRFLYSKGIHLPNT